LSVPSYRYEKDPFFLPFLSSTLYALKLALLRHGSSNVVFIEQ
jgi:hypothetical protein